MTRAAREKLRVEVSAALMGGMGIRETARRYNMPPSTVHRIKEECAGRVAELGPDAKRSLDDLLVESLQANLVAQQRIAACVSNEEYIRDQPADGVARLFEALADHSVRLLEAASWNGAGADDEPDPEDP